MALRVLIMSNALVMPDVCTVRLGEDLKKSEDFVAILTDKEGKTSIYYQTDALTLGMAIKLVAKEFVLCMNKCTQEERDNITAILGDAFIAETPNG